MNSSVELNTCVQKSSKSNKAINLTTYSIIHALVDASCATVIFYFVKLNQLNPSYMLTLIVLYNILAFAFQAPFGYILDKLKIPHIFAAIGCVLTAIGMVSLAIPFIAICFIGIGNALFHVGGGVVCLNLNYQKASLPGIYVAPGAIGLFIGAQLSRNGFFLPWIFIVLLMISAVIILKIKSPSINYSQKANINMSNYEIIIILFLLSISIRAFIGLIINFPWKGDFVLLLTLTLFVALGKALGGVFADKFGWMKVTMFGLIVSAPLLSFGYKYPILSLIAVFMFNMSMPVTLTVISNMLPGRTGFAFGLTTLALVIGALPVFFKIDLFFKNEYIYFIIVLTSIVTLYFGFKLYFSKISLVRKRINTQ